MKSGFSMQINNNEFRPDLKWVKIIKSTYEFDVYYFTAIRIDRRPK